MNLIEYRLRSLDCIYQLESMHFFKKEFQRLSGKSGSKRSVEECVIRTKFLLTMIRKKIETKLDSSNPRDDFSVRFESNFSHQKIQIIILFSEIFGKLLEFGSRDATISALEILSLVFSDLFDMGMNIYDRSVSANINVDLPALFLSYKKGFFHLRRS